MSEFKGLTFQGWVIVYACVLVCISYFTMLLDKDRAVKDQWRLPEGTLLFWAFWGGALGAKIGQKVFRHKTRKEPFRTWLNVCLVWNGVVYLALLVPPIGLFMLNVIVSTVNLMR